jgi:hypothetical protein
MSVLRLQRERFEGFSQSLVAYCTCVNPALIIPRLSFSRFSLFQDRVYLQA